MKLELKVREYNILCEELDKYKKEDIDENDERLYELLKKFKENHNEIVEIKSQLKELENIEESNEKTKEDKQGYDNLFKKNNDLKENFSNTDSDTGNEKKMIKYHENIFKKLIRKIKQWLKF